MADPRIGKPTPTEITALAGSYLTKPIYTSTVFDYLLNLGDGLGSTVVSDISGNALTATGVGTVAGDWQDTGLLFSVGEYAETAAAAPLNLTGDLSVEVWVQTTNWLSGRYIFSIAGGTGETEAENICIVLNEGTAASPNIDIQYIHEYSTGVNELNTFNTNLSTSTIYHIVAVRDVTANTVILYIDGVAIATFAYTNDPTLTANPKLTISANFAGGGGNMTNIFYRVHGASRVWSPTEVLELFDDPWGAFTNAITGAGSPSVGIRRRRRKSSIHR